MERKFDQQLLKVLKYYNLVPKCVDFPDGEVKEAKSLKLPYQFNNDDDIESRDPRTDL